MIRDYLYYIKFRIQDRLSLKKEEKINQSRRKKLSNKKRYTFQKTAIILAAILWLITAANVLWGKGSGVSGQDRIISAFSSTTYADMTASITSYGKYGNVELTDTAKKIILEKIAEQIGINRYHITDSTDDNNSVKTLSQSSSNGDVICKFVTMSNAAEGQNVSCAQYIYIGITLKNSIDSAFTYEKIVKNVMKDMEIDTSVTVNLKGQLTGKLDNNIKDMITDQILSKIDAKIVSQNKTDDLYTIYAYDNDIKDYIVVGSNKVNVNLAMSYDELKNITYVYFSTPINNQDY
jgi:hypothetical protein